MSADDFDRLVGKLDRATTYALSSIDLSARTATIKEWVYQGDGPDDWLVGDEIELPLSANFVYLRLITVHITYDDEITRVPQLWGEGELYSNEAHSTVLERYDEGDRSTSWATDQKGVAGPSELSLNGSTIDGSGAFFRFGGVGADAVPVDGKLVAEC